MGLSPRRINQAVKQELRAGRVGFDGSREVSEARTQWRAFRRVPVPVLAARIGIAPYLELPCADLGELRPAQVRIALRQHIGAPALAVVRPGDRVRCGDLLGEIPPDALGARVHASLDGTVLQVDQAVVIAQDSPNLVPATKE
jgi:hypothetical protein